MQHEGLFMPSRLRQPLSGMRQAIVTRLSLVLQLLPEFLGAMPVPVPCLMHQGTAMVRAVGAEKNGKGRFA
jgi:hypothetical protein